MAEDTIVFRLAAAPEALWPYVSATARLNREAGLPAIRYSFAPRPEGGVKLVAKTRKLGLAVEWVEEAFEWAEPEWYLATRRFPRGPIRETRVGARFRPSDGGTEVALHHTTETRGVLGVAAVWALRSVGEEMRRALEGVDAFLGGRQPVPFAGERRDVPLEEPTVARAREALGRAGVAAGEAERLVEHLRTAPDDQVIGMRAFALADRWGSLRIPTLRMFLHATRAGLLDLRWSIRCPSCRGVLTDAGRLMDIRRDVHCGACNIRWDADFDQSVEVRFNVHPAVRAAEAAEYCLGGPGGAPHVRAQLALPPGQARELPLSLPPGSTGSGRRRRRVASAGCARGSAGTRRPRSLSPRTPSRRRRSRLPRVVSPSGSGTGGRARCSSAWRPRAPTTVAPRRRSSRRSRTSGTCSPRRSSRPGPRWA